VEAGGTGIGQQTFGPALDFHVTIRSMSAIGIFRQLTKPRGPFVPVIPLKVAVCACFPPKVHDGTQTLRVGYLLCDV